MSETLSSLLRIRNPEEEKNVLLALCASIESLHELESVLNILRDNEENDTEDAAEQPMPELTLQKIEAMLKDAMPRKSLRNILFQLRDAGVIYVATPNGQTAKHFTRYCTMYLTERGAKLLDHLQEASRQREHVQQQAEFQRCVDGDRAAFKRQLFKAAVSHPQYSDRIPSINRRLRRAIDAAIEEHSRNITTLPRLRKAVLRELEEFFSMVAAEQAERVRTKGKMRTYSRPTTDA